jgi:hypothetical protein
VTNIQNLKKGKVEKIDIICFLFLLRSVFQWKCSFANLIYTKRVMCFVRFVVQYLLPCCVPKNQSNVFVTQSNFWDKRKKKYWFQYMPWYCDLHLFDQWSISVNLSVIRSNWKRKVNSQQQKKNCLLSIPYNIPSFSDRKPCKSFFFLDSIMYPLPSYYIRTVDKANELKYYFVILWKCLVTVRWNRVIILSYILYCYEESFLPIVYLYVKHVLLVHLW